MYDKYRLNSGGIKHFTLDEGINKMNLTRRSFLHMGGMMSLAAIVSGATAAPAFGKHRQRQLGSGMTFPIPASAQNDPLAKITMAMWEANINTKFNVSYKGAPLTQLVLIAV